jgi:hypothetical protein
MVNYMNYNMPRTDFSVDPVKDAEEKLRMAMMGSNRGFTVSQPPAVASALAARPSVLQKAKESVGGTLTSNANEDELGTGRQMLSRALTQLRNPVDVAALNEFAQQRAQQGDSAMLNALAAQFAGERFQPVQAQYLRRSMAAQEPMKVGNYGTIAGGRFVADPYAQRDVEANAMINVGGKLLDNEEAALRNIFGSGSNRNYQQSDTMVLPTGRVVKSRFNPSTGEYEVQTDTGWSPAPAGARPGTPSMGGPQSATQFFGLINNINTEKSAIRKLDNYLKTVGDANVGIQRWADGVVAKTRTLFGSKTVTPDQLAALRGPAQLQALLGLFREDIVGPGVMTEYDAQRVLNALGGDFNQMQNPEFVRSILSDIRQSKLNRISVLDQQAQVSAPYFPGVYNADFPALTEPAASPTSGFGEPPAGAVRRK